MYVSEAFLKFFLTYVYSIVDQPEVILDSRYPLDLERTPWGAVASIEFTRRVYRKKTVELLNNV